MRAYKDNFSIEAQAIAQLIKEDECNCELNEVVQSVTKSLLEKFNSKKSKGPSYEF